VCAEVLAAVCCGVGVPPQVCRKQYQTAMELEEHLSSYDHHHTKVSTAKDVLQLHGHMLSAC
jgi:hypothetical protein